MMVTVLLPGGGVAAGNLGHRRGIGCARRRAVVTIMLLERGGGVHMCAARGRRGGDHRDRLAAQRIVDENSPGRDRQPEQAEQNGEHLRRVRRQLGQALLFVLAERGVEIIRCHGGRPSRIRIREFSTRGFRQKSNGAAIWAAPCKIVNREGCGQFGIGAFGLGGNAELTCVPRSRSSAMCSALSSFGSGGT